MSDTPEHEEAPRAPIIDHVPADESVAPSQRSARPDEIPPPPQPGPEREVVRRGGTPFGLTLLLCAALGGGIYWTWTHPYEPVQQAAPVDPQPAIDAAKADILQKVQVLAEQVATLQKQQATDAKAQPAPAPSSDALADLSKRLDDMAGHLNELSAQQAQDTATVQKLQSAVAQSSAAPPAPEAPAAAEPPAPSPAVEQAQQQLADLGNKLDAALTQEKTSLDALSQRLGKLEQGNEAAAQAENAGVVAAESNSKTIASLSAQIKKLEQGEGQIAGVRQDATLAVKLSAAQVALSSGQPLGELPNAPPALARFASKPPPTMAGLRAEFPQVAQAALAASRPEETQKSFFARALARLEQTVTVRRGDQVIVGDPAAGVLAKAQMELNEDDLKGAVHTLGALTGKAAQAVQGWVSQANELLAARDALAQLAAHG